MRAVGLVEANLSGYNFRIVDSNLNGGYPNIVNALFSLSRRQSR